jgi:hypothetical protein
MRVLEGEAAMIPTNRGDGGGKRLGPVLPQTQDVDSAEYCNVFDPIRVPGRRASS